MIKCKNNIIKPNTQNIVVTSCNVLLHSNDLNKKCISIYKFYNII